MTLVDTSALLAFLDRDDEHHERAVAGFEEHVVDGQPISHNYVLLETAALVHRRGGTRVARRFMEDIVPLLEIAWVDEHLHRRAATAWAEELKRGSSLVDHASFELMRERGVMHAFAFDRDFTRAGFTVVS